MDVLNSIREWITPLAALAGLIIWFTKASRDFVFKTDLDNLESKLEAKIDKVQQTLDNHMNTEFNSIADQFKSVNNRLDRVTERLDTLFEIMAKGKDDS